MIGCKALSKNEINIIISRLTTQRDKTLFITLVYTGFRIKEILMVKVSDILNNGIITNRLSVSRQNMKGKVSSRSVFLHERVKQELKMLIKMEKLNENDYIFQSRKSKNNPLQRVQAWRIIKKASIGLEGKIGLHSTRKTFADRMYNKLGKDILKTSKALGHKNINSTISYLSFKTEEIDNAIQEFD